MKNIKFFAIALCLLAGLLLIGACSMPYIPEEFEGTWVYNSGGTVATMTIDKNTLTIAATAPIPSNMTGSIVKYDTTADTMELIITESSGLFMLSVSVGNKEYAKYRLENSGKEIYINFSTAGYPTSVTGSPYFKQ